MGRASVYVEKPSSKVRNIDLPFLDGVSLVFTCGTSEGAEPRVPLGHETQIIEVRSLYGGTKKAFKSPSGLPLTLLKAFRHLLFSYVEVFDSCINHPNPASSRAAVKSAIQRTGTCSPSFS